MALNSIQLCGDIIQDHTLKSIYSAKEGAVTQCRLANFNSSNGSIISSADFRKKKPQLSPYLQSDRPLLLSHYMDKKFHKQKRFPSSFPLAVNLYKANSDEFKLKKQRAEKNKKSVLTLPNEPIAQPQSCTVSDMNDSEYFNNEKKKKPKRKIALHKKKIQRGKNYEFVDRDAKYCSQVNIDLDCSSTDTIKRLKCFPEKKCHDVKMTNDEEVQPHDVWAVLRNINRFQFRPSPAISEDSLPLSPRKKKPTKKNKQKTARVFETCRTEEYAYTISNIDVESKSNRSSSIDRITVIEGKGEDLSENKSIKPVSKELKLPKNQPRIKKAHNRLKLLCSPKVRKNELSTNIEAELGRCNMVKNNRDNSITVSNSTKSQDTKEFLTPPECSVDSWQVTTEVELMHSSFSNFSKEKVSNKAQFQESHTFNGTAKVILSKGHELASSKRQALITSPRKPRTFTTMPSVNHSQPKLTQADIRRRLANIKFPIIILGKDQLSGTIEVQKDIYSQFDGLDKQIWPFMVNWSDNVNHTLNSDGKDRKRNIIPDFHPAGIKKPTNFLVLNKQYLKIKKPITTDISPPCPKVKEHKLLTTNNGTNMQSEFNVKTKPIRQLRDKMLKLLYKKSSSSIAKDMPTDGGQGDVDNKHIPEKPTDNKKNDNGDKVIDNYSKPTTHTSRIRPVAVPVPTPPSNLFAPKQQWGKAKWASSFIDNVMKKIRSGVYYTHDNSVMDSKSHSGSKEISIQVGVPLNSIGINVVEGCDDFTPKITMQKKREALAYLPGFDDDLPQIEIESMTRNQLTVKHCVTNVMLQFDVCVPLEQDQGNTNYNRSMACVPLTITESKIKVYKCKAKIFNAMLPAEICSILPKLMNKLENPDTNLAYASLEKTSMDSCLSTITEISGSDIVDTFGRISFSIPLIPQMNMSPELRIIANGAFPIKVQQQSKCKKYTLSSIDMPWLRKLLPKPKIHAQHYHQLTLCPLLVESKINRISSELPQKQVPNSCTGLVSVSPTKALPWDSSKYAQIMMTQLFTQVQRWMPNVFLNFNSADITVFEMNPLCNKITVGLKSINPNQISNTVSIDLNEFKLESLYNAVMPSDHTVGPSSTPVKSIKNLDKPKVNKVGNKGIVHNIHKHKKKTSVTRYTKCKSTSHISVEKSDSTALSKITNMENFFQALGTSKPLADAYDGYSSRKILAFIIEMKSWITEISPRQALLVLLLSNKKDTSNLVRFRPVILQGIAVNRITRNSELDMEIEVIERESFNKLSEFDGTLEARHTVKYDDNLLEELYWIAKTTASDYQRTFDESSEKLLKALLEKRKRLNPSYLRVMARYVGLGLLKSPKN